MFHCHSIQLFKFFSVKVDDNFLKEALHPLHALAEKASPKEV